MKKILTTIAIACLFAPLFSLAADEAGNAGDQFYYSFSVTWDSESNALSLAGDESSIALVKQNLLKDTGSGSQFYARVINFSNQPEIFQSGERKIYLGRWKLEGSSKKGEVKITVPYFADGSKITLFSAKDKKVALVADVSKLAKIKSSSGSGKTAKVAKKAPAASMPGALTYQIGGHSAVYWWTMRIIVLAVLVGIGYFIYRWRKKKKMQAGSAVDLQQK